MHESLIAQEPVGRLRTPLLHYSYRSMEDVRRKIESYSQAGAKQMHARGKRTSSFRGAIVHGGWAFIVC